ncbi:MAG: type II secretion system F family protein [Candidatus Spechtbacterales bacterium]|nr:type II secretion system F family protein [Candidatus Spechtbacterales bacterium]
MAKFSYKIVSNNQLKQGSINALSLSLARRKLDGENTTVLSLKREDASALRKEISFSFSGFPYTERINFYRDLSIMIQSGLSMVESLRVLKEQLAGSGVKKAVEAIASRVEGGEQLSRAMRDYPKYFSPYIIETIHAGETAGRLSETLYTISQDLQKDYEVRRKVISAITYPVLVIAVMIAVAIAMMIYILPQIAILFEEFDAQMPLPTRILIGTGEFFASNPFMLLALILGSAAAFFLALRSEKGKYFIHSVILKTPVFKNLIKNYNLVIFFRALGSLVASGTPFVRSVEIAEKTVKNEVYRKTIASTRPALLHGVRLAEVLEPYPKLFPKQTQKIISVGESTGNLEKTFGRITEYYEEAVDHQTKILTVLIEPILMLLIGVVVGGLALSIFLPIYQAASLI